VPSTAVSCDNSQLFWIPQSFLKITTHNREFFLECTPKAAFQDLNLSVKHSKPFPNDLKIDQDVLKARETVKRDF